MSQHLRIDDGVDREPAPVGQRDLDAVFAVGGWLGNRLAVYRAGGIRSNLHRKKLRATARDKLARPEIPTPPCQQSPRNLISPGRRGTLPKAPKALFDNPNLLRIRLFPPPTFVANRENLDL